MATNPSTSFGPGVSAGQIKLLSDNFAKHVYLLRDDGKVTPYDPAVDTKSIWFSKSAIDQLFQDNGFDGNSADFGLRIYLGFNDKANILTDIADEADNKIMTVLVATTGGDNPQDLLNFSASSARATETAGLQGDGDYSGTGLDHGKICPPEICGGV